MTLDKEDIGAIAEAVTANIMTLIRGLASKTRPGLMPYNPMEFDKLVAKANKSGLKTDRDAITNYLATHQLPPKGGE